MSLKAKIILSLKTKYKNLGFSDKTIEAVANYLETTVEEEGAIEEAVTGVEPFLKSFQQDADKRVTEAVTKATKEPKEPNKEPKPEKPQEQQDEVPQWAKGLLEANKIMLDKISELEGSKTTESRKNILENLMKETPESFRAMKLKDFGRMSFKDETEFDTYKTELEADLTGMAEIFKGQTKGADNQMPIPAFGSKGKTGISTDTEAYIAARKEETSGKSPVTGKQIF